ncbi:MAG: hypothetical protein JWN67_2209, partial [Actinomycetia bacterium]|nr:hypothetical protein [Actinomycetes bacterium]
MPAGRRTEPPGDLSRSGRPDEAPAVKRLVVLLLLGAFVAGCGGGGSGAKHALSAARASLEGAKFGRLDLVVRDGGGDHFGVSGSFSYIDSGGNAVLELTYDHQRPGAKGSTKLLATGT